MMLDSAAARLLLTCVFAAAALGTTAALARRQRPADRAAAGFCIAMCAALIAMTWWAEPTPAVWPQVAAFSGAALWLLLRGPIRAGLHHALMAAAMAWMLTGMPAPGAMPAMAGPAGLASMASASPSVLVLVVSGLVAASCVATSIPWLRQAVGGPGLRVTDPGAVGQAAMSVGMAAMVIAML
jgi:uncharacterized protein DUF5134